MALALDGSAQLVGSSGSSGQVTLTTAGSLDRIVVFATINGAQISSIADTAGLTWHKRAGPVGGVAGNGIEEWYADTASALTNDVITLTLSASSTFLTVSAFGVTGASSYAFDSNVSLPATATSGYVTLSTTTAAAFIFAGYREGGGVNETNPAAAAPFTGIMSGVASSFSVTEYEVVSSAQTNITPSDNNGAGNQNGGIGDAIVAGGAAAPKFRRTLTARVGSRQAA